MYLVARELDSSLTSQTNTHILVFHWDPGFYIYDISQVQYMHDLVNHLHTSSLKVKSYEAYNWKVHKKDYLLMIF